MSRAPIETALATNPDRSTSPIEDLQGIAKSIAELAIVLLGLAYICGFLVLYTFFNRYGIHDSSTEALRIRYIHTGLLCLAFPIFLLIPITAHLWMYLRQTKSREYFDELKAVGRTVGQSRIPYTVQLVCMGFCFYVFLLYEPYGALHHRLFWVALLLASVVMPGSISQRKFGFAAEREYQRERWGFAAISIALLVCSLWGSFGSLAVIFYKGLVYWVFIFSLLPYLVRSAATGLIYWYPGQQTGVHIARWAIVVTLSILSTLAFAYRLFPQIPADKGGGNYSFSRNVRVCVSRDMTRLPSKLRDSIAAEGCTALVKIIDSTENTLYVARSDDSGGAPSFDRRSAPEIWADGQYFPDVYALPRSKVSFLQYYSEDAR